MNYEIVCVTEFHKACDVPVRAWPNQPPIADEETRLRMRLCNEEPAELMQALIKGDLVETADGIADTMVVVAGTCVQLGIRPTVDHSVSGCVELVKDVHHVLTKAIQSSNWNDIAVASSMMQVVCYGIASVYNIPYKQVFDAVHFSNMAKVDPVTGKVVKDAGGKVLKPTAWPEPQPWEPPTEAIKRILGR